MREQEPLDILRRRYAADEITQDEPGDAPRIDDVTPEAKEAAEEAHGVMVPLLIGGSLPAEAAEAIG
ncbi:MAG TPA: hypothetical protein VFN74_20175 [Chloroflexota bacterium]|nr:hypothetical protein [Chloroflexota bacterium]